MYWGRVLTSCSNGSEDSDPIENPPVEKPEIDPDVLEGWTAITIGDIETYAGQDGTAEYTVTKNNNGSIAISHDAAMAKYASCSFKPDFGDANTLYTKITNNSDVKATVQVQVNKAGTEANGWEPTPTVVSVYVDGKQQSNADAYSVECELEPGASVVIANKFDTSKNPDTIAISLNSQDGVFGTVAKGKITVSGISVKEVTDESELGTPSDDDENDKKADEEDGKKNEDDDEKADDDKKNEDDDKKTDEEDKKADDDKKNEDDDKKTDEEVKPAEATVIYKLDFSGEGLPGNHSNNCKDGTKIEFKPNEGVQMTGSWSEFSISPKDIGGKDLASANYIKVSFKCSADAAFGGDNARFMVGAFKNSQDEDGGWSDKNLSWTCFFDKDTDGGIPTEVKTVEKEINWEQKADAEGNKLPLVVLSDISGFKIFDCNFAKGTLTVQSIEFIKK